jgi:hypothetical protein
MLGSSDRRRCNEYLGHAWLRIDSLDDLHDGVKLCALLEVLGSTKVTYKQNPRNRMEMLGNANAALTFFKEYTGMQRIVSVIGPEDIVDKNKKLMLGFIWSVILRWQGSARAAGSVCARSEMLLADVDRVISVSQSEGFSPLRIFLRQSSKCENNAQLLEPEDMVNAGT